MKSGTANPRGGCRGAASGGTVTATLDRKEVGPFCPKLPLPSNRKGFVIRPLTDSPAPDLKPARKLGIGVETEGGLGVVFRNVLHMGSESRPLDCPLSSTLDVQPQTICGMDTFDGRLQQAMDAKGLTPSDLIKAKVLSKAGVYLLLNGTTTRDKVRASTVAKLCKVLHISDLWLTQGRGSMDTVTHGETFSPGSRGPSQSVTLDERTLWDAELLVAAIEELHGKLSPRKRVKELARQYNQLATTGEPPTLSEIEHRGLPKTAARKRRAT